MSSSTDDDGCDTNTSDDCTSVEQEEIISSNDSEIVLETLRVYGSLFLACNIVYVLIRHHYPKLFNVRAWSRGHYSKLARRSQVYGYFNWWYKVFTVSDDELLEHCGMDAICFLRALKFGRKISLFGCFNAMYLIPTYQTAKWSTETDYITDPLVKISISYLPQASYRFVGTVVAAYLIYIYVMILILQEFYWFTKYRHKFMSMPEQPRNYAVYVSGIPNAYQSSRQLQEYFNQVSKNEVLEAHIVLDTPKLDKLVARRANVVQKLEHVVALEEINGIDSNAVTHTKLQLPSGEDVRQQFNSWTTSSTPSSSRKLERTSNGNLSSSRKLERSSMGRSSSGGKSGLRLSMMVEKVESVREYREELSKLNKTITRAIHSISSETGSRRTQWTRTTKGSKDVLLKAIREDVEHTKVMEKKEQHRGHTKSWIDPSTLLHLAGIGGGGGGGEQRPRTYSNVVESASKTPISNERNSHRGSRGWGLRQRNISSMTTPRSSSAAAVVESSGMASSSGMVVDYDNHYNHGDHDALGDGDGDGDIVVPVMETMIQREEQQPLPPAAAVDDSFVNNNTIREEKSDKAVISFLQPPTGYDDDDDDSFSEKHFGTTNDRDIENQQRAGYDHHHHHHPVYEDYTPDDNEQDLANGSEYDDFQSTTQSVNNNDPFLSFLQQEVQREQQQQYIDNEYDDEDRPPMLSLEEAGHSQNGGSMLRRHSLDTAMLMSARQEEDEVVADEEEQVLSPLPTPRLDNRKNATVRHEYHDDSCLPEHNDDGLEIPGARSSSSTMEPTTKGFALPTELEEGLTNNQNSSNHRPPPITVLERSLSSPQLSEMAGGSERSHSSTGSGSRSSSSSRLRNSVNLVGSTLGRTSQVAATSLARGSRVAGSTFVQTSRVAGSTLAKGSQVAASTLAKGSRVAGAHAERLMHQAGDAGIKTLRGTQNVGTNVIQSAGAVVPMLLQKSEGSARDAGFVVFKSLYATAVALQMIHHPTPYVMSVDFAGDPKHIYWRNVGLPQQSKRSGRLASAAATTVLCFFWSVPMAFISSLTELNSLKESLPKLGEFMEERPWAEKFLALLAPLLLLFINESVLPVILKYFATWEGHISSAMLEASLFVKLSFFMIIQTFFVSAISGGIAAEVTNILENPERVIDLLANSLPAQSSFFIQIIMATTFFLQSLEILRIYPLSLAFVRRFIGPRLTAKERRRSFGFIKSLDDPPDFWYAETFAQLYLLYLVFFVYAVVAPITSFFLAFCFALAESGYRFQYIHNYPRSSDTGGRMWRGFITFTLVGMLIGQLTLIGFLALKKSPYAGPALGPLLAITVLFIIFINQKHSEVTRFLPTRDCILKDSENNLECPMDTSFLQNMYLQPSLQQKNVVPDYEEIDELDDYHRDGPPPED